MKNGRRSWRAFALSTLLLIQATAASAAPAPLSWRWLSPQPNGDRYAAVCIGKGRIVAVGDAGMVGLSQDGRGWEAISTGFTARMLTVNCDGPKYLAYGISPESTTPYILSSSDGRSWQQAALPTTAGVSGIAYGNGRWLILLGDGKILSSTDAATWKPLATGFPSGFNKIKFGSGRFVVVADGRLYSSTDGSRWSMASPTGVTDVAWGKGKWLATAAISAGGTTFTNLVTSTDGLSWRSARTVDLANTMFGIKSERFDRVYFGADGLFYAVGTFESRISNSPANGAHAISSYDLVTWGGASTAWFEPYGQFLDLGDTYLLDNNREVMQISKKQNGRWVNVQQSSLSYYGHITSVTYGDGTWVALTSDYGTVVSQDGEAWTQKSLGPSFTQLRWLNGRWVGVNGERIYSSGDLQTWSPATTQFPPGGRLITGKEQFLFVGTDGQLYASTDGLTWAPLGPLPAGYNAYSLTWTGDQLLVSTEQGAVSSVDGVTWVPLSLPNGLKPIQFAAGGGRTLALARNQAVVTHDGQGWEPVTLPASLYNPHWVGDRFVALVGMREQQVAESIDGLTWQVNSVTTEPIKSISWAGSKLFLGVEGGGLITTKTGAPPCGAWWSDLSPQFGSCAAVRNLSAKGIVSGTPEGAFLPSTPLTRAAFAKMVTLALGEAPDPTASLPFTDTKGHWGAQLGYLQTATRLGLIIGMPDGRFDPDGVLTRAAAIKIVTAAAGLSPAPSDLSPGQPWYSPWYRKAWYGELLTPLAQLYWWEEDPTLDRSATRGEAAILIDHFLRQRALKNP